MGRTKKEINIHHHCICLMTEIDPAIEQVLVNLFINALAGHARRG